MKATRFKFLLLVLIPLLSCLALFSSFEIKQNHSFWSRVFDAGHAPLFFLVTVWIYLLLSLSAISQKARLNIACILGVALAAMAEVIQPYFSRDAEWGDLINGALGAVLAAWLIHIVQLPSIFRPAMGFAAVSCLVAVYTLFPAFQAWQAGRLRDQSFPLIASYEHAIELHLWSSILEKGATASALFERSVKFASAGEHSLYVKTFVNRYAGVTLDAGGLDIASAKTLEVEVFNPGKPFEITIRIDDDGEVTQFDQRFNKTIPLRSGQTLVMIPISEIRRGVVSREFNLTAIRRIMLFVGKQSQQQEFYIDNLRVVM